MNVTQATAAPLRADFKQTLERRLEGWLGRPGTPERAQLEKAVDSLLTDPDKDGVRHLDLSKLDDKKTRDLQKLQKASQDFEAVFVKGLLAQMRKSSFAEDAGPMGDLAKDMMDQALSESLSQSQNSVGIAKTVFLEMAQRIVRTSDLAQAGQRLETKA